MSDSEEQDRNRKLGETIAAESGISAPTLRRMLANVADYIEIHHVFGLPDDLRERETELVEV